MSKKDILIASDHGGFDLKKSLISYLEGKKYNVVDCGPYSIDNEDDYPDFAHELCGYIKLNKADKGILICGSGIGMSIAANKHQNIRAALCITPEMAELSRLHNDANILCLGARITTDEISKNIVDNFLDTKFEGGRHKRRVGKI